MYPDEITPELQKLAGEAFDWFETAYRGDDPEQPFVRTKDDAPEWLKDLVREAHGEMFPDDWRYDTIHNACGAIHDASEGSYTGDVGAEFADSAVDVYNNSRFAWLGSNINRQFYVDDAVKEFGFDPERGVSDAVGLGQYQEATEIFYSVATSLGELLEDEDD